jgi:hypothetical protein
VRQRQRQRRKKGKDGEKKSDRRPLETKIKRKKEENLGGME